MSYTKGPWTLVDDGAGFTIEPIHIGWLHSHSTDEKRNKEIKKEHIIEWENAALITAAPELIEVLQDIERFGFTYCIDADTDNYRVSIPIETYDKAKAALIKAGLEVGK